ncbi:hypothetical protein [Blastococcus capsensis]|uniref:hypothetical protein n=1 Tax=Blastococcus capsensis TaxID=1564163 RepID=UPI00254190DA|nr:hypothetical protein [Blastococcus capsensis]MDK3258503.1 hypothetical protein [Blastococcus capsensis]
MTISPPTDAPVRSTADLTDRWLAVLGTPEFAGRSLWLTWFGTDGRQLPVVIPVDDLPPLPDQVLLVGLRDVHATVLGDQLGGEGHLALALCRPGGPEITADDEAWAEALRSVLDEASWSLHLAAAGNVLPLADAPSGMWGR